MKPQKFILVIDGITLVYAAVDSLSLNTSTSNFVNLIYSVAMLKYMVCSCELIF